MFCHLAVLIYLCGQVRKKGCNCSCPFERNGNWISLLHFFISTQRYIRSYQKKVPIWKRIKKMQKKIIKPFIFMRNLPCPFTAVHSRSALAKGSLNPKVMKGISTLGSGIDQVISVLQRFLHLQRQGKRPKLYAKQKRSKNFFKLTSLYYVALLK